MGDRENIIHDRKLILCLKTKDWSVPELLQECPECRDFLLYCCACNNELIDLPWDRRPAKPCHHFYIVITDGACTNNGRPGAKAGVGVAYGNDNSRQLSKPITDIVDNFPLRSNQRAERCAAKLGLELLAKTYDKNYNSEAEAWIVATDSRYVVEGMTELLPKRMRNNWRTSKGTKPANLDLFLALHGVVATHEAKNMAIAFWLIQREHSKLADGLAKAAAVYGDEARMKVQGARH